MANTKKATPQQDQAGLGELRKDLDAALVKRAKLEFQHNVAPLKNPIELRLLRREIARLRTHLRAKEAVK